MIVVSDTSPITSLLQIGKCGLLQQLFGEVVVPPRVREELLRFHPALPEFIQSQAVRDANLALMNEVEVDRGEAEAIALAQELRADYLLMDEKRGRRLAEARGLKVIGLLGALLLAKRAGLLDSLRQAVQELEARAGFFVSDLIKETILRAAGEL